MNPHHRWMIVAAVAAVVGMYLMGKFHRPHHHLFSTPAHESFPMPPSTPDRG